MHNERLSSPVHPAGGVPQRDRADEDKGMTSDLFGKWRKAAADLTDDILQQVSGYGNDVASKKEDALGPRKRAMGRVAGLNEAINMAKAAPEKGGL